MNSFFNYIQPTIVRASFDEELPENVRGRFFINFNVFGIKYFEEQYILSEGSNNFQYLIRMEQDDGALLTEYDPLDFVLEHNDIVDIPRIYIDITDEFVNDTSNTFKSFVYQATAENAIWGQGLENFLPGHQYYLNHTLYNYLISVGKLTNSDFSIRLPNYLKDNATVSKYWIDLSNEPYKDYGDLDYFNERNKILTNTFSEDELNNFYSTFCGIILKYTKILPETLASGNNMIYKQVLTYYNSFMNDAGSNAIATILNSLYTTNTNKSNCGCNTEYNQATLCTSSCFELYKNAMTEWLVNMLSDPNFYTDWFRIDFGNDTAISNDVLIGYLKDLIDEFVEMRNLLTFSKKKTQINCSCPTVTLDENDCNYGIIKNYLNVLDYVSELKIKENQNKIKIYGGNFAKILPSLQF